MSGEEDLLLLDGVPQATSSQSIEGVYPIYDRLSTVRGEIITKAYYNLLSSYVVLDELCMDMEGDKPETSYLSCIDFTPPCVSNYPLGESRRKMRNF